MKWGQHIFGKDSVKKSSSGGAAAPKTGVRRLLRNKATGDHHEINPDGSPGKKVDPKTVVSSKPAEKNAGLKAATGEESSADRYSKIQAQVKAGEGKNLSDQDLKFFNARTEALQKVAKINEKNPGWLQEASKKVLQQAAQRQMQQIVDAYADKYISGAAKDKLNPSQSVEEAIRKGISDQTRKKAIEEGIAKGLKKTP